MYPLTRGIGGHQKPLWALEKRKISSLIRIKRRFLGRPGINGHQYNGDVSVAGSTAIMFAKELSRQSNCSSVITVRTICIRHSNICICPHTAFVHFVWFSE